ncbi:MAG: aminotransferase class IV [Bacteroidota bacterium]
MCRLFESIRIENGIMQHRALHEMRMNDSRSLLFGKTKHLTLKDISIPHEFLNGVFKCRVVYQDEIETVEFLPYEIRAISTVALVEANSILYNHKYLDRSQFDEIRKQRPECDELIIVKDGYLTDSTYSNIAFFDGVNWFTPSNPLLKGVRRQSLLNSKEITEMLIPSTGLNKYITLSFINAMMDLGDVVLNIQDAIK